MGYDLPSQDHTSAGNSGVKVNNGIQETFEQGQGY